MLSLLLVTEVHVGACVSEADGSVGVVVFESISSDFPTCTARGLDQTDPTRSVAFRAPDPRGDARPLQILADRDELAADNDVGEPARWWHAVVSPATRPVPDGSDRDDRPCDRRRSVAGKLPCHSTYST